ncbi:MerR family transcriptional regulator [Acetobacterium wieringae]|uniref:MerR family transcriptional regulator n=1 Tax=Acetobacterium wieringae TaxID=52694 RepID=A0ABY6HG09_9FIRM|nr:MerR family DNA-binding transcriptional regulator [Acetobacterium wieringae]UYO63225.1 MerR family transcriptional regulator [Acetobacterium wieringae]VUZ23750.1 Uncharacterised protein [Acetobacterium wieringae]
MSKQKLFTIGEISKICKIPISTLRFYDQIGVITAEKVDANNGYRYYSSETLILVPILKYYKEYNFKLNEIHNLLKRGDLEVLQNLFSDKINRFNDEISLLQAERDSLTSWYDLITEANGVLIQKNSSFQLKYLPEIQVISYQPKIFVKDTLKHLLVSADFTNCFEYENVITYGPLYIEYQSTENRLAGDYRECTLNIQIHKYTHETVRRVKSILGYAAICGYHKGTHENIDDTYSELKEWANENNYQLNGRSIERYVIDYWSTNIQEQFVTEIILPINE